MRALLCRALSGLDALAIEDMPVPTLRAHEVLVRIHACGLNFPDVLMTQGKYQRKPPLPFSPGCEFAGVVEQLGAGATEFSLGGRVCGIADCGGLAEFIAIEAGNLCAVPDEMNLDDAAAYLYTYSTCLYALRDRGELAAGESLLVLGAGGGIGIAAVEIGKALGARVTAAASSEVKLSLARSRGADQTVLYPAQLGTMQEQRALTDRLKATSGPNGFDVICDPVGGPYSEPALRSIGWDGRFLVVGFAAGTIPGIPLNLPLLKGCQIVGVLWGGAKMRDASIKTKIHRELAELFMQGKIRPQVAATFRLDQGVEALKMLAQRRAVGKVVVRCISP